MRRKRPPYAAEFREQMIELVGAGRTPEEVSREFEPSPHLRLGPTTSIKSTAGSKKAGSATEGIVTLIELGHARDGFERHSRRDRHMSP